MLKKAKLENCSNQLLIIRVGGVTALNNKEQKNGKNGDVTGALEESK